MSETNDELQAVTKRLGELNTKAYYLLVALSFMFIRENEGSCALKLALALTALAAVWPLQDYAKSKLYLEVIRWFKVVALTLALLSTLYWVGCVAGRTQPPQSPTSTVNSPSRPA